MIEQAGKQVCEFFTPMLSDRAEELCQETSAQVVTALALGAIAICGARACRNRLYSAGSTLHECARSGNLPGVKKFALSSDVDTIDTDSGDTALIAATRAGHAAVASELLKTANPNIGNASTGDTAFHVAIREKKAWLADLLLKKGDQNVQNAKGQTPLMEAVIGDDPSSFEAVLGAHGTQLDLADTGGNTVLHHGAKQPTDHFVRKLVGADANKINQEGELPLHLAAAAGLEKNIELLVPRTGDVNTIDKQGRTPFFRAVEGGFQMAAKELLKAADPNIPSKEGTPPLLVAAKGYEKDFTFALDLIESGKCDLDAQDAKKNTAAHVAAEVKAEGALKALQEKGANLEIVNDDGETAISLALKNGIGVENLLSSLSAEALQRMKVGDLLLVDFAVAHGLGELLVFLESKEIYFEFSPDKLGRMEQEMLKVACADLRLLQKLSPLKITEIPRLIEELETPTESASAAAVEDSEELAILKLSIRQYLERMALQSRFKQQGKHVERAEVLGAWLPMRQFVLDFLGKRKTELYDVLNDKDVELPLPLRAFFAREYTLGELLQYSGEAFRAFVPIKF